MAITKDEKKKVIATFAKGKWDTWSAEVQVAILTSKIENLKAHLDEHKNDNHSRRWILLMVAKRRKMLNYLKKTNPTKHEEVITKLGLRK